MCEKWTNTYLENYKPSQHNYNLILNVFEPMKDNPALHILTEVKQNQTTVAGVIAFTNTQPDLFDSITQPRLIPSNQSCYFCLPRRFTSACVWRSIDSLHTVNLKNDILLFRVVSPLQTQSKGNCNKDV